MARNWTRSARVRALAAVNVALGAVLLLVTAGPSATAQDGTAGGPDRMRGSYMLVGGKILAGDSNTVYVIDTGNQEMVAVRWDEGRRRLDGVGYRDLRADAAGEARR